jgi:hypothetical protein
MSGRARASLRSSLGTHLTARRGARGLSSANGPDRVKSATLECATGRAQTVSRQIPSVSAVCGAPRMTRPSSARTLLLAQQSEKAFQAQVRRWLDAGDWLTHHTFDSRRSAAGFPDPLAVHVRRARLLAVELRRGAGELGKSSASGCRPSSVCRRPIRGSSPAFGARPMPTPCGIRPGAQRDHGILL